MLGILAGEITDFLGLPLACIKRTFDADRLLTWPLRSPCCAKAQQLVHQSMPCKPLPNLDLCGAEVWIELSVPLLPEPVTRGRRKYAHAEQRLESFGVASRLWRNGRRRGLPAAAAPGLP